MKAKRRKIARKTARTPSRKTPNRKKPRHRVAAGRWDWPASPVQVPALRQGYPRPPWRPVPALRPSVQAEGSPLRLPSGLSRPPKRRRIHPRYAPLGARSLVSVCVCVCVCVCFPPFSQGGLHFVSAHLPWAGAEAEGEVAQARSDIQVCQEASAGAPADLWLPRLWLCGVGSWYIYTKFLALHLRVRGHVGLAAEGGSIAHTRGGALPTYDCSRQQTAE